MNIFLPADMLLPQVEQMEKWAVIACDQFTSQPEYWKRVRENVGENLSTLHMILPEAELSKENQNKVEEINHTMEQYLKRNVFQTYEKSYIYVERALADGTVRKGVVGVVDLEAYDYSQGSPAAVRATEKTVIERIPPRKKIREKASLELSHVLLLCDDEQRLLIEPVTADKDKLQKLYEFELMEGGGQISGWLLQGEDAEKLDERLEQYTKKMEEKYPEKSGSSLLFAVGDGNHSLASAKACYEELKQKYPDQDLSRHSARYAMVELENIHDEAQQFEPIHRIVKETDAAKLLEQMKNEICSEEGIPIVWYAGQKSGTVFLDREKGELPVGILQSFLDSYLEKNTGVTDYIHGDDTVKELASKENTIGFLLPAIDKGSFFRGIVTEGVLPRKTFSMGHAKEKRYYLETRKIR